MEKNFLEMLDSLPAEQKQPFIDHFVQTVLGKSASPLILTTSKTISNDASLDERIRLTAEIYGIDPKRIDKEEFLLGEKEIAESKMQVRAIIQDYFGQENNTGQRSKNDELISLGKFLYTTQMNFQITPMEVPDFLLTGGDKVIGLEHTRLEAGNDKAYIAEIWKKYLNETVYKLLNAMPGLCGVGNLTLDTDRRLYEGKSLRDFNDKAISLNRSKIINHLTDYIRATINGEAITTPAFVKTFSYQSSNESFSLKYNQDYFVRSDFSEMVQEAVRKKEKRIDVYKENAKVDECWLLLVYGDANLSSGFKVNENSLMTELESTFNRIFILNSFNQACFEVQKGTSKLKYIAQKQFRELLIR
ncbi:hypothetical protein OC25_17665 [Pedobacter kyungheensis]|uniref:Uncharacterized protein n=1 Tax=Pedobacter kyungheensis TaxID=1069985 RepID=A0A0C1D5G4_9SPHI|nr:hypothetical protein [Pedobacter kyungheensis]KIA92261.1 hypothetical protein OC25_17665 [Pedobacter kyungheensis]